MNLKLISLMTGVVALLFMQANGQPVKEPNIGGTVWAVSDSDKVGYVIEFQNGGSMSYNSSNGTSGKGTWRQKEGNIYFTVNGGFAEFNGKAEANHMTGNAMNRNGRKWQWEGFKEEAKVIRPDAPTYPPIAAAARVTGAVIVEVKIDPQGKVISAATIVGNPLLRGVSESSAAKWQFDHVDNSITRTAHLVFAFTVVPNDCKGNVLQLPPVYAGSFLVEVKRKMTCPTY